MARGWHLPRAAKSRSGTASGRLAAELKTDSHGDVSTVAFSPDGGILIVGGSTEMRTFETRHEWMGPDQGPDAVLVARSIHFARPRAVESTGMLWIWTLPDRERVDLRTPGGDVASLAFTPDGKMLVTANRDGTILIWGCRGASAATTGRTRGTRRSRGDTDPRRAPQRRPPCSLRR